MTKENNMKMVTDKSVIAIVLSFLGGMFTLIGGVFRSAFVFFGSSMMERFGSMSEFMRGSRSFGNMMNNPWSISLGIISLVSGLAMVIGAFMLDYRAEKRRNWALLVLAGSIVSFIGGSISGLHVGSILGIIGGALAFPWASITSQTA